MGRYKGTRNGDNIQGSDGNDTILGYGGVDFLRGLGGQDVIRGGAGSDVIIGGNGADILHGDDGDDSLTGGNGDSTDDTASDRLYGDAGDDIMGSSNGVDVYDGGAGDDRVDFFQEYATQGVIADLAAQTIANDGFGNAETMTSVETLGYGTVFADKFYGSDEANGFIIDVGDTAIGLGGDDRFYLGSVQNMTLDGGDGTDSIMMNGLTFQQSGGGFADHGASIDLGRQLVKDDGFGFQVKFVSVENASGASQDDRLVGGRGSNVLTGYGGNDVVDGRGGDDTLLGYDGSDKLTGGAGRDTFVFTASDLFIANGATDPSTDTVTDFAHGDRLDFSGMTVAARDGVYAFIGQDEFSGAAGEIRFEYRGANTFVLIEADGQTGEDFVIKLSGQIDLTTSDLVL